MNPKAKLENSAFGSRLGKFAALLLLVATPLARAGNLAESVVVLKGASGHCLGYALDVPNGEKDAVLTLASCLKDTKTGAVEIALKEGEKASSYAAYVPDGTDAEALDKSLNAAIITFSSGTLENALSVGEALYPSNPKLAEQMAGIVLSGSPVFGEKNALMGLARTCKSEGDKVSCGFADLRNKENRNLVASFQKQMWGENQVPVHGKDHLAFGRRCRRGWGGGGGYAYYGYGGFSYTSVNIVIVQQTIVYAPRYTIVNSFNNNCNSFNRGSYNNTSSSYGGRATTNDSSEDYYTASRTPVETVPAYLGIYDRGAAQPEPTAEVETRVASRSRTLSENRDSERIALALPDDRLNLDQGRTLVASLQRDAAPSSGQWSLAAAKRREQAVQVAAANREKEDRLRVLLVMR